MTVNIGHGPLLIRWRLLAELPDQATACGRQFDRLGQAVHRTARIAVDEQSLQFAVTGLDNHRYRPGQRSGQVMHLARHVP